MLPHLSGSIWFTKTTLLLTPQLLQREPGQWVAALELIIALLHERIIHKLDRLEMDTFVGYSGCRVGTPEHRLLSAKPS